MADTEYVPLTADSLKAYVRAQSSDDEFVASCWAQAVQLVDEACEDSRRAVPESVSDLAKLGVGSELFHRRQAPNGVAQFANGDGNPVRIARDPMVAAWPLLRPYVGLGIG